MSKRPVHVKHSYAQCGEDLILSHLFNEIGIAKPIYVDIGAHHPQYLNNTYLFYLRGALGLNIEPDPTLFQLFLKERPNDTNLNIGISDKTAIADLYIMNEPTLNTFSKEEAERVNLEHPGYFIKEVIPVQLRTINDVLKEGVLKDGPDLMSIDVEGLDELIVRSMDASGPMPKVMCIETITFSTKGAGSKKTDLIDHVKNRGYAVYADTYINTIFLKEGALAK